MNALKKKLEWAKADWAEELHSVLWAYRITPKRATGESPFMLAYGTETVIPVEIGMPTQRTQIYDPSRN